MTIGNFWHCRYSWAWSCCAQAQTEPATKPMRLRVSSGVAEGLKTHDVTPKYPREAREKGIQGDVILQATIDTKGNMTNLRAVQGDPILAEGVDRSRQAVEIPAVFVKW